MSINDPLRVACIGGSITFGLGLPDRRAECYPAVLGGLLGERFAVRNFGFSGATAGRETNEPYWQTPSFTAATRYEPKLAVIALGTNDAQHANSANLPSFRDDYIALSEQFRKLDSRPEIVLVSPPPVFGLTESFDLAAFDEVIRPTIEEVADVLGFGFVDAFSPFDYRQDLFPDNLHPNATGARLLAEVVFEGVQPLVLGLSE